MNAPLALRTLVTALIVGDVLAMSEVDASMPPAAYTYDPVQRTSTVNRDVLSDGPVKKVRTRLEAGDSFTIEAFADPDESVALSGGQRMPVFGLGDRSGGLRVGIVRGSTHHWWQADLFVDATSKPVSLARKNYRGLGMVTKETPWRHLAVTWDAATRTASFYLDYRLQQSVVLDAAPPWDVSRVAVEPPAGDRLVKPFAGAIDDVRVSAGTLKPWEFLRASDVELSDVSFEPEVSPALPDGYGHIDVRLHYGAVGDGVHDDTAAIQRAFDENSNRVPIEYKTVYFPAGTYRISDSIRFSRFMVVRGAGRDRTVIKLDDGAAGYEDKAVPKPAFAVGYDWPYVGRTNRQRAGNVIGNFVFDLAIDVGANNPAALGLDFHSNNVGAVENVSIRCGENSGLVGLDLKRGWPGPCLLKNIDVTGFDIGIDAAHREYSLVFSNIRLKGQREVAINNGGNALSLENVSSDNAVPAVLNRNGGLVVLIDSRLRGGDRDATAIESTNGSLYLRNVDVGGYGVSLRDVRERKEQPTETLAESTDRLIDEYVTGPSDHSFPVADGSLKLPVKQTPTFARPPVGEWVNVRDFESLVVDGDWAPAIQAAIDAGGPLVFFPSKVKYAIKQDVIIRGAVRTFFGGNPKLSISNGFEPEPRTDIRNEGPAFRFDAAVERFEFDMLGVPRLIHDTPVTLLVHHCQIGQIDAGPECGELFIEDSPGKWRFGKHQRVWGRHMNPETKGIPEIINDGGQFWVLGLKTEYLSTKIVNTNGARTEVLGGLMYPVHPVADETLPMFINEESDLSLIHAVSAYRKNHKIYIRDTRDGETKEHTDWHWVGGRPIANLYRSEAASP